MRAPLALACAVAFVALAAAPAFGDHSVIRLVSVDPPGTTGSLAVSGPNQYRFTPIVVTSDGRTALYTAGGLYKSSGGQTELVGVGPGGIAATLCVPEHSFCKFGMSADGRTVVFETPTSLLPEDSDSCSNVDYGTYPTCPDIYERVGSNTTLLSTTDPAGGNGSYRTRLDSISPDASRVFFGLVWIPSDGSSEGAGVWEHADGMAPFPSATAPAQLATIHREGMSDNGRRVFFSTSDALVPADHDQCTEYYGPRGCTDVYERTLDGMVRLVSTSPVSQDGPFDAIFGGASADGSRVFFSTAEPLLTSDTDNGYDVYERMGDETKLVSTSPASTSGPYHAGFDAVSADGKRIFLSTDEPLVPQDTDSCTEHPYPPGTAPGCTDVYEYSGGTMRLLSTGPAGGNGNFEASFAGISKDGSHVLFTTDEQLVSSDTDEGVEDIYERVGGETKLVSTGPASLNGSYRADFNEVSDDGQRVFFTTNEPLVSEDTDCPNVRPGDRGCPDVYERSGGVTTLITPGSAYCSNDTLYPPDYPAFVASSSDGRRVLFVTPQSLVPEDTDTLNDLYVAIAPSCACRADKPGHTPKKCAR
jgi:hypothetical protein